MLRKTLVGMAAALALCAGTTSALAQGTAITYQGQLKNSGTPVNTRTDMRFTVYTTLAGPTTVGNQVTLQGINPSGENNAVNVSSGLFAANLDFGLNPYTSLQPLYLLIEVRPALNPPSGAWTPMGSRQLITPAPFSLATRGINVDAAGQVGIGTNTPNRPLHIRGDSSVLQIERKTSDPSFTMARFGADFTPANEWKRFNIQTLATGRNNGMLLFTDDQRDTGGNGQINSRMVIDNDGDVGIGTTTPVNSLEVQRAANPSIGLHQFGGERFEIGIAQAPNNFSNSALANDVVLRTSGVGKIHLQTGFGAAALTVGTNNNVGIGTNAPQSALTVTGTTNFLPTQPGVHIGRDANGGAAIELVASNPATNSAYIDFHATATSGLDTGGRLRYDGNADALSVENVTKFSVNTLEIRGGSDLVEGFDSQTAQLEPGTLMVIDPAHPGQLMPSTSAYDSKVAGIVSGANGVNPGIKMGQDGVMDGKNPIAMTGRVYVKCTTANGNIQPGDLLTTSDVAGHAMKASDRTLAPGAVVGKAMSALDKDTGLVLVLVNLQ